MARAAARAVPGAPRPVGSPRADSRRRTVGAPPLGHAGRFLRRPPVMLGQDQLHRALESLARRTRAPRQPVLELGLRHAEKRRELRPPALQELALLQDARAHLCPSWVMNHGAAASKPRSNSGPGS